MADRKDKKGSSPDLEVTPVETLGRDYFTQREGSKNSVALQKVFRGRILLNEGISAVNFYSSWAFVLYLGIIGISYSTLEPQYLSQELHVPDEHMGKTTAWLYLADYSIRLLFALLYGPMIDHYGRKFVMTIGITLVSVGYFLIPILNDSLFPGYFGAKSVTSCGLIAIQMLPLAADYVEDSTKGVMAGMNFGIAFVGGGIGAIILKALFWFNLSYRTVYWVFAGIILSLGYTIRLGIKGGNSYYKTQKSHHSIEISDRKVKWREVKRAFKEIPWVTLSVIFGILGNADFYILTTGLVIWVRSLLPESQDAVMVAANYQVIFFVLSFVLTGIVALKIDKVSHMKLIFPILIIATLGFIAVPFVDSATSPLMYVFFAIEGASLPGVFVFSAYLSYRYNPPEIRGTLSGIGNCIGFLGAIIILTIGGFLHDHWRKDASFLLYGGLLIFSLASVFIIYRRKIAYQVKGTDKEMKRLNKTPNDESPEKFDEEKV